MTSDHRRPRSTSRARCCETEADAILGLIDRLGDDFERALELLFDCRGRVDRHRHGQVGHHLPQDRRDALEHRHVRVLPPSRRSDPRRPRRHPRGRCRGLALSHSGETEELVRLLESIRRIGARLIAHHRRSRAPRSARAADVTLDCGIAEEACPMNLVPTASTTAALALGDALAMTLLVRKGFREEQFASLPSGRQARAPADAGRARDARRATPRRSCATTDADAGRHSRDVEQAARHDLRRRRATAGWPGSFTDGDLRRLMVAGRPTCCR